MMSRNVPVLLLVILLAALLSPTPALAADSCTLQVNASGSVTRIGDNSNVEQRRAQDFIVNASGVLTELRFQQGANSGSPTGNIGWEVRGTLTGTILASGSVVSSPSSEVVISVSGGPVLSAGNTYYFILFADAQATNTGFNAQASTSSSYADGMLWTSSNGGTSWSSTSTIDVQIRVMTAGLCSTPTPTAFSSATPSDTATPTITPSPTANYGIEITATSGAPMKLERTATYGDLTTFGGLLIVAGVLFFIFVYTYWRDRARASIDS